jgi:hypothetical protein
MQRFGGPSDSARAELFTEPTRVRICACLRARVNSSCLHTCEGRNEQEPRKQVCPCVFAPDVIAYRS